MKKRGMALLLLILCMGFYACKSVSRDRDNEVQDNEALNNEVQDSEALSLSEDDTDESTTESLEKPEITSYEEPDFAKSSSGVRDEESPEDSSEGSRAATGVEPLPDIALISEPDSPPDSAEGIPWGAESAVLP
jgi:hypothetical protein